MSRPYNYINYFIQKLKLVVRQSNDLAEYSSDDEANLVSGAKKKSLKKPTKGEARVKKKVSKVYKNAAISV